MKKRILNLTLAVCASSIFLLLTSCASAPKGPDPRIGQMQGQINDLQKSNTDKDATVKQLQDQIAADETTIKQLQAGNTEVSNLQKDIEAKKAEILQLQAHAKTSDDQVAATSARVNQIQAELEGLKQRSAAKDAELTSLNQKLAALTKTNADLAANVDSLKSGTTKTQAEYVAQIDHLNKDKVDLQDKISALEKERDTLAIAALADQKDLDARVAQLKSTFSQEIARGDLEIRRFRNILIVSVKDSVVFDPDSPKLRQESLALLTKLAIVFKADPNRIVRVEGNTAVALSSAEAMKLYPTSWQLGAARAANVVQYLQEKCSMDPLQLVATSLGEFRPRADNSTEAGKAKNRRVDFILVAKQLYDVDQLQAVTQ